MVNGWLMLDARSSLSPRAGRGRGEGALPLPERFSQSLDRCETPGKLRIAERPLTLVATLP